MAICHTILSVVRPSVKRATAGFRHVQRQRVYQQVIDQIRDAILAGQLAPGEPLPPERELVTTFGVSRTSVREALRALEAQGLLSPQTNASPQSPLVVSPSALNVLRDAVAHSLQFSRISLRDLVDLRCVLEAAAARRAADHRDHPALSDARIALERQRRSGITPEDFEAADVEFHIAVLSASGNEAVQLVMLGLRDVIEHYLLEALRRLDDREASIEHLIREHTEILASVERGDGEAAARLLDAHIRHFYRRWVESDPGADAAPPKTD